jgi:mannose-6-phosphate isomerase-like protein (cupin superfamily)
VCADYPVTKLPSYPDTGNIPPGMLLRVFEIPGGDEPVAPFMVSHWSLERGTDSGIDQHPVREFWLIAAGRGVMTCGEVSLEVSAGDVMSLEPNQPHTLVNNGDGPCEVFSVWWPALAGENNQ